MANTPNATSTNSALYIVSTPIGNLEDITLRALRTLKEVNLIAAEDTRRTRQLLAHFDIHTPITSFFEGNQARKGEKLISRLKGGDKIALVSDAGTPTVSDPGYQLLVQCIEAEIPVVPIPGVSACIAAASVAGLPLHSFVFEGFLSPKSGKRRRHLEGLSNEKRTLIFYESPHRLIPFLQDVIEFFGNRRIAIARELTKKFEEIFRGNVSDALETFQAVFAARRIYRCDCRERIKSKTNGFRNNGKAANTGDKDHLRQVVPCLEGGTHGVDRSTSRIFRGVRLRSSTGLHER